MDKNGPFITGCLDPFKGNGVVFSYVAPHIQNDISISKINIMIGHRTASERLSQSHYSWAVSDTGLVFDIDDAE
jgi:hypothetical protein